MKNMETPDGTLVCGGYEVKQDCPLRTRRRLAGLHQIQTTAGSASTTSDRMSLLLDRLQDEDANEYTLYHRITVMLEECGVAAEEGIVVCFVYEFGFVDRPGRNFGQLLCSTCSPVHSAVAKRWGGVGRSVKFVGLASVDAMAAMEKRGLHRALGTFKEVEGITPDRLRNIVGYMDGTKSTLPGLKKL